MPGHSPHQAGATARDMLDGAAATETVSLYIVQFEPSMKVVFNTRPISALLGYSLATHPEMTLDRVHELLHPDELDGLHAHLARIRTLADGEIAQFRHRMRAQSGAWSWIEVRDAVFSRDASGAALQVIGTAREITDQMRAAEALLASEARHRLLVETMLQGVVRRAADGTIIGLNAAAGRILGRARNEFLGSDPVTEGRNTIREDGSAFHGEEHPSSVAQRSGQSCHGVVMGVYNSQLREYRWLRVDAVPLFRQGETEPYEVYTVFEDITRERQSGQALQDAHTRKDHFIATLAHELRNPLAPIRHAVAVQQLKHGDDPELVWSQAVIERQVGHMARLLDDLLDSSRIASGKLELRRDHVSLGSIVQQAVETAMPLLDAARHTLTITLPATDVMLHADPMRLSQVFSNLLSNAAKYTEPGGKVVLKAQVVGTDVVVCVRDTGIGIASQHLQRIFEMFGQLQPAAERSQGGLGIGLSLAQSLVEMHGGRISAQSDGVGRGTEFTVLLPVSLASAMPDVDGARPSEDAPPRRRRVLVVDDNRDGCESLAALLGMKGFDAEMASDAYEALARVQSPPAPEVVLLDVGLPGMNGYDACAAMRALPGREALVIIAVTGWGTAGDLQLAMDAGFDGHLVKPVDMPHLMQLLLLERDEARALNAAHRMRSGRGTRTHDAPRPVS